MIEGSVMEFTKWFIAIISGAFVLATVIFLFQLNQVNSFQQEVNYQIERHGGLTDDALMALDAHAKSNYGGCLEANNEAGNSCKYGGDTSSGFFVREYRSQGGKDVWFDRGTTQAQYGTEVRYALVRKISIGSFENIEVMNPAVTGVSVSRVRGTMNE